jgi:hypothetical protein
VRYRATAVLALFALTGCLRNAAFGYTTPLVDGYSLASDYSGSFAVIDSMNHLVTHSSKYGAVIAVQDEVIAGNMDTEENAYGVPKVPDRYFVIDTRKDSVREELSEADYRIALRDAGVNTLPRLRRPNAFTRFGTLRRVREGILEGLWLAAWSSIPLVIVYYIVRRVQRRPRSEGLLALVWTIPILLFIASDLAVEFL